MAYFKPGLRSEFLRGYENNDFLLLISDNLSQNSDFLLLISDNLSQNSDFLLLISGNASQNSDFLLLISDNLSQKNDFLLLKSGDVSLYSTQKGFIMEGLLLLVYLLSHFIIGKDQGNYREAQFLSFLVKGHQSYGVSLQYNLRYLAFGVEADKFRYYESNGLSFPSKVYYDSLNKPDFYDYVYYHNGSLRFPYSSYSEMKPDTNASVYLKVFPLEFSPIYLSFKVKRNLYGYTQKIREIQNSDVHILYPSVGEEFWSAAGQVTTAPNLITEINTKPTYQFLWGIGSQLFTSFGLNIDVNWYMRATKLQKNVYSYNDERHYIYPERDLNLTELFIANSILKRKFGSTTSAEVGVSIGFSVPIGTNTEE